MDVEYYLPFPSSVFSPLSLLLPSCARSIHTVLHHFEFNSRSRTCTGVGELPTAVALSCPWLLQLTTVATRRACLLVARTHFGTGQTESTVDTRRDSTLNPTGWQLVSLKERPQPRARLALPPPVVPPPLRVCSRLPTSPRTPRSAAARSSSSHGAPCGSRSWRSSSSRASSR